MEATQFRPRIWWAYLLVVVAFVPGSCLKETRALVAATAVLTLLAALHTATEAMAHVPALVLVLGMGLHHGSGPAALGSGPWHGAFWSTPFLAFALIVVAYLLMVDPTHSFGLLVLQALALSLNGFIIGCNPLAGVTILAAGISLAMAVQRAEKD